MSRRSNILVKFGLYKESLRSSTVNGYVAGDLAGPEDDKWRRAVAVQAISQYSFSFSSYNAIAVARALDDDIGSRIEYFRGVGLMSQPIFSPSEEYQIKYSQAIVSILRKLTLVRSLELSSSLIHPVIVGEVAQALRQMHELHTAKFDLSGYISWDGLDIRDAQLFVRSCPRLQEVYISGWRFGNRWGGALARV